MNIPILNREEYVPPEPVCLEHMFAFYDSENAHSKRAPMIGDPNGEPYIVQIHEPGYFRLSILIFAASEEDAYNRVKYGCEVLLANAEKRLNEFLSTAEPSVRAPHHYEDRKYHHEVHISRVAGILRELESRKHLVIAPFDKRFVAKVPWALNDTIG